MVFFKSYNLIYGLLILLVIEMTVARPSGNMDTPKDFCKTNLKILEVCQRCAKATKSTIVYPMCCSDEELVYSWCDKYIHYGYYASKEN